MKIATIGTGMIGGTLARRFASAGHQVLLSHRGNTETLGPLVAQIGPRAAVSTPADAAATADVIVIAVPLRSVPDLPAAELAGKIVIDPTNYYPARDGHIDELDSAMLTSSERNARLLPGSRLVKAFNTIYFENLLTAGRPQGSPDRIAVLMAGDDADAKTVVAGLADDIGFDSLDVGALGQGGWKLQPGGAVYNQALTRDQAAAVLNP